MSRPVSFGLMFDFRNPADWREPWVERYRKILDEIAWIDAEVPEIGGAFVTEHHFFDDGYMPCSLLASAAIIAQTKRLRVGTNVLVLPLYHPIHVAEQALVNDVLSGGRFRLGVGAGYVEQEFEVFGVNRKQRPSRTEEGLEIIRAAFGRETFLYAGRRYPIPEVRVTPPPIREGGPQVWVGAESEAAIDRAARLADGFYCTQEENVGKWIAACDRVGRPPETRRLSRSCFAIIDEDPERAYAEAGAHFLHLLNEYARRGAFGGELLPDSAVARTLATGVGALLCADAAGAIATIDAAIDQGVTEFLFSLLMPGEPVERLRPRVRYFAERVAPFVKQSDHPALASAG